MPPRIALLDGPSVGGNISTVTRFIRRQYAPFLLRPVIKGSVLLIFLGAFVGSIISMQHIELGLGRLSPII